MGVDTARGEFIYISKNTEGIWQVETDLNVIVDIDGCPERNGENHLYVQNVKGIMLII